MNWTTDCGYAPDVKRRFHSTARARLRQLANELRLPTGSYDLRSNQGGIAVSGEITLHHEAVYIQVSQSALGGGMGVLIRTCRGRRDYTGGPTISYRSRCSTTCPHSPHECGSSWRAMRAQRPPDRMICPQGLGASRRALFPCRSLRGRGWPGRR